MGVRAHSAAGPVHPRPAGCLSTPSLLLTTPAGGRSGGKSGSQLAPRHWVGLADPEAGVASSLEPPRRLDPSRGRAGVQSSGLRGSVPRGAERRPLHREGGCSLTPQHGSRPLLLRPPADCEHRTPHWFRGDGGNMHLLWADEHRMSLKERWTVRVMREKQNPAHSCLQNGLISLLVKCLAP